MGGEVRVVSRDEAVVEAGKISANEVEVCFGASFHLFTRDHRDSGSSAYHGSRQG